MSNNNWFEWERIQARADAGGKVITATDRAKCAEGWLVRFTIMVDGMPSVTMTFVPDPLHTWKGEN